MSTAENSQILGVYFPGELDYSGQADGQPSLKRALVYFDQLLTVIPEMAFTGDNYIPHYFRRAERVERLINEASTLIENGVLKCVNPVENIDPQNARTHFYSLPTAQLDFATAEDLEASLPEILFAGIVSDIADEGFRSLVEELGLQAIPVFTGQLEINWLLMLARSGHKRDMWDNPKGSREYGGFTAFVSPELGAAVLLNHALVTAIKYGAIPVANSEVFHRLLAHKMSRTRDSPLGRMLVAKARTRVPWERDSLAKAVLNLQLPDFELTSFDDVLEMRDKAKDELCAFRSYLAKLGVNLKQIPTEDLEAAVNQTLMTEIEPALAQLRAKLYTSGDKFFLRVVKGLRSAQASIPLVATTFVGLPLWMGCLASAGATVGEAALETYFERREIRENNGLSFLLRFD